jgi:hypothetical protein
MIDTQNLVECASFVVPASEGSSRLAGFFSAKQVLVDPRLTLVTGKCGLRYSQRHPFPCHLYRNLGKNDDTEMMQILSLEPMTKPEDANRLCALLVYLGGEGSTLLKLPRRKSEGTIILGYVQTLNETLVLSIRHEQIKDKDTIYLRANEINHWINEVPMILVMES